MERAPAKAEGRLGLGDGDQKTIRDWAVETNITQVQTRPERIQRLSRRLERSDPTDDRESGASGTREKEKLTE
jgi:hypothetical protein